MTAVCIIAGLMTAGLLADVGQLLLATLLTVAGRGNMGASGVEWFVDGSRDNPSVVSAVTAMCS